MTDDRTLVPGLYLVPTPAGALHAVTSPTATPAERVVRAVLQAPTALRTDDLRPAELSGARDDAAGVAAIADAQGRGWLEGHDEPPAAEVGPLGTELPAMLAPLSDEGRAALVDDQGFPLGVVGFDPDEEVELSALAAEIIRLRQRRSLVATASAAQTGWGLIDRSGASAVALYPITIGVQPFVLLVGGLPRLHHPSIVPLVAALSRRYAVPDPQAPTTTGGVTHA